jgi:uncharacterized phage protein gp47/JayE
MTFISNSETSQPVIDYSSRDYLSVYTDLLNRIPAYLPEWTSRSNSDFGIVLLQMFSYVADILGYYEDRIASEAFLQTATQPRSILNIAAMLNYIPGQPVGATAVLQITITNSVVGPYTIPAGTAFQTVGSATQAPIVFQTNTALTIAGANAATPSTTGTVVATQGVTVTGEQVGTSDGTVNQSFALKQSPLNANSLTVYVDLGTGPAAWTYVPYLINYGPFDQVYTTFVDANQVTYVIFGDNVNGYVPPLGSPITATYTYGVGSLGNVGANTIIEPVNALIGVASVTNPAAANGGANAESLASIALNAPIALKALSRAVTATDVQSFALQVSGVQWASAQEVTYQLVNLYIAPTGGGNPTSALVSNILNYIDPALMANTTVTIQNPVYVGVNIIVTLVVLPNYGNTATQTNVNNALANLLSLTNTGFGFRVSLGVVYSTILDVPGVNYAIVTSMNRAFLCTLTAPLSSGTGYSVLTVSPLPEQVNAGDIIVVNPGGSPTQTLSCSQTTPAGSLTLPVNSFTANATYAVGTPVQDTTGASDLVFLPNEIPVTGTFTFNTSGGLIGS